uniref:Nuclear cap-binding protein subunit 1 n=2 Tax=Parascaris univalens TaxID=6257 RepID=A0A914ZX30_PARUN
MVEKVLQKLHLKLQTSNYSHALRLVIFLSDLVNCHVITPSSFIHFIEGIIETAFEESIPQVRSDWFIYAVLRCLPYVGRELYENESRTLEKIITQIGKYIAQRNKHHVKMLQAWRESPHEQEEYLDCLWAQIGKLQADSWKETHLKRYYVAFDGTLAGAMQHDMSDFSVPAHSPENVYPLPSVIFRLFDYADCPDEGPLLPGAHSIERFLVEEDLHWIIEQNIWNKKQCAMELFAYRKRHNVPISYATLEVIFSQLFRLPEPPTRPLFYGSLIIELCKLEKTMPQVVAQAAELLYQRIDTMQFSLIDQFVDWFSFHLSNFDYRWSWSDWSDCLNCDTLHRRQFFMREVAEKCMRLSYHQRMLTFVPASFHSILPEKPEILYYLGDGGQANASLAARLNEAFQERTPPDKMTEMLKRIATSGSRRSVVLSTFVAVLLNASHKTISFSFSALTKYFATLKEMIGNSDALQLTVLRTVYRVWIRSHQMVLVIVNKMINMTLLEPKVVVEWILSDEMNPEFAKMWTWELLNAAFDYVGYQLCHVHQNAHRLKVEADTGEDSSECSCSCSNSDSEESSLEERMKGGDNGKEKVEQELVTIENEIKWLRETLKNLLLSIVRKFIVKLTQHVAMRDSKKTSIDANSYVYIVDRFSGFLMKNWKYIFEFKVALEEELCKSHPVDAQVIGTYEKFLALKS